MFIEAVSAKRAIQICGFDSVAMLDYLQRSGVFVPNASRRTRRGKGRRYNFRDLMVLRTISTLLKNGASVSALKSALVEFQQARWNADRASLDHDGNVFKYCIVEGKHVHFVKSDKSLYDITLNGQMSFAFVIDVDKIHSHIINGLEQHELLFH